MKYKAVTAFVATIVVLALLGCQAQLSDAPRGPEAGPAPGASTTPAQEPDYWPTAGWKSSTPEAQGVESGKLAAMFDAIEQKHLNLHSVLIIRNGYIIAEAYFAPYSPEIKQQLASVGKSVMSMLTGIAIGQGRIRNTVQPVLEFFPDRTVANLDPNKRSLTLEHLLTMTSGFDCSDGTGARDRMFQSSDWVQFALDLPITTAPGTEFRYCSPAAHLLSPVLEQATGKSARELANDSLFAPLGIPAAGPGDWDTDPQGVPQGFGGLRLTPRDMAKLGLLYLHAGNWNGKQVIPASWVAASMASKINTGSDDRDYGYLIWLYSQGYVSMMGLGGQDVHIIPDKNMVVVLTAAMDIPTHDVEAIKLLDEYLVPAASSTKPLAENAPALADLQARTGRAASTRLAAPPLPALARTVSGKVYKLDPNDNGWETISLAFEEGSAEAVVTINGAGKLVIGLDNVYRMNPRGDTNEAARGHWEGGNAFVVDDHTLGAFMQWQLRFTFPGDEIQVDAKEDVTGQAGSVHGRAAN